MNLAHRIRVVLAPVQELELDSNVPVKRDTQVKRLLESILKLN